MDYAKRFRLVDLKTDIRLEMKEIRRVYLFTGSDDAQRVKAEFAIGIQDAAYQNGDLRYLKPDGAVYGFAQGILSSSTSSGLKIEAVSTSNQDFTLTLKATKREKPIPKDEKQAREPKYNIASDLQVEIVSKLPISGVPLGRAIADFFRPYESKNMAHYRQEELEVVGQALGGIEPVFELQRRFQISPNQVLAALDNGRPLEEVVKDLLEREKKTKKR